MVSQKGVGIFMAVRRREESSRHLEQHMKKLRGLEGCLALWGWRMGAGKKSRCERQGWKGEQDQIGERHVYMAF